MTDNQSHSDDAIDRLVGDYVRREIEQADATKLLTRIRMADGPVSRSAEYPSGSNARPGQRWTLTWAAMTSVAVLIAFLGGRFLSSDSADASTVLRTVQSEHARKVDHCYRVQFAPDPRYWDGKNQLEGPSTSVLWTRGDRFWSDCTIGKLHLQIGREADGTLWISSSPSKGIRFTNDASRLPKAVSLICAVNSMSVPRLVEEVRADFDLHTETSAEGADGVKTIVWAKLKPDRTHSMLSDALLEIDPQTNILNKLVLWMVRDGHPSGTVTFTLMESAMRDDRQYQLQSHLNEDAEIEIHTLSDPDDEPDFETP